MPYCRIDPETGCWIWQYGTDKDGYAKLFIDGKHWRGPRAVLHAVTGELGPMALHSCHRPRCMNPDHLRWGTAARNARDMWDAGRAAHNLKALPGSANGRSKLNPAQRAEITELRRSGAPTAEIAERFGIGVDTVWRVAKAGGFTAPVGRPRGS